MDGIHKSARIEVNGGSRGTRTLVYAGETRYYRDWDGRRGSEPWDRCYGAGAAGVAILPCVPASDPLLTERIEPASFGERPAVVLERVSHYPNGAGGYWILTSRTYLDTATMLHFVEENIGTAAEGGQRLGYGQVDYIGEFVASNSLPAGFFEPSSMSVRGAG